MADHPQQIFDIIPVHIEIEDINDNAPRFPKDIITLYIPEDAQKGKHYQIDGALDPDKGQGNCMILLLIDLFLRYCSPCL